MAFDGISMPSSVGTRQVSGDMVPSPEQISSITACSDADAYSDTGPFDGGQNVPGNTLQQYAPVSSSRTYVQHKHINHGELNLLKHGGFPENTQNVHTFGSSSLLVEKLELPHTYLRDLQQESSGILPGSMLKTRSTCEDLLKLKPLVPGSVQFYQWHQQPDEPYEAQSQYYLFEEDDFSQKIMGQKEKLSYLPSESSNGVQHVDLESSSILVGSTGAAKLADTSDMEDQIILQSYLNYKRKCIDGSLVSFVKHMHSTSCNESRCNCNRYLILASHFDSCHSWECNMCRPVRRLCVTGKPPQGSIKQENGSLRVFGIRGFNCTSPEPTEDIRPPLKRLKTGNPISFETRFSEVTSSKTQPFGTEQLQLPQLWPEAPVSNNVDAMGVSAPVWESLSTNVIENEQMPDLSSTLIHPRELIGCSKEEKTVPMCISEIANNVAANFEILNSSSVPVLSEARIFDRKEEREVANKSDQAKLEGKSDLIAMEADSGIKLEPPKILSVSLIDCFTVEELKEHLSSLRQCTDQEVKGTTPTNSIGENSCQLCSMDKLSFAPVPIYCSRCGVRIKCNLFYYCGLGEMGSRHCFCTSCFKASRSNDISFYGISISKEKLHKERNNHEDEESWVQCDKCKCWQHQICALYNDKRDFGGNAEYICPKCILEGREVGEQVPLPKSVAFAAKDLPTTMLSDYIEQRLFRRLKQDREERAKALQKKLDEVPEAADLVVRVVLSVKKLLQVKQQFLDIVHYENYPTEFPYGSKVILLFQKIEGVDVCLFGMYVQEFGSECGHPNQRSVYISYLDSVKFFRPEIKTATGEALRTFVYHEILIGYLDYCKKRGFATCYIWACPPLKGEDYILYCHPEIQKTPKSDKLRQWYKSLIRKAAKENIVVDCTNVYDHFFVRNEECKVKITAARLPYFDGDYLSGAAVNIFKTIDIGSQSKAKQVVSMRTLKAMGHPDLSVDAAKDIVLMQKLGHSMSNAKEDFIMVRLQCTCTCCHELILSGSRWCCNECKNFQLCGRCHDVEQHLYEGNTHISSNGEKHFISQVAENDVSVITEDSDAILYNGYFENRHSLLSFCQENHYQFDTLRRAKHSSMMILYHLHNSSETSVGTSCCICHQSIVLNHGWHCEICPAFDACDGCYQRKGGDCHIHKLSKHTSVVSSRSKNGQAQQRKHKLFTQLMNVLMHASQCNVANSDTCSYPHCFQMKKLFRHAHQCKLRFAGGCQVCKKSWMLLKSHSKNCGDSNCRVPRCLDIKRHTELLALQSETRRRAAVKVPSRTF
ncbi:Histone acetyltransferase [Actinidia chinensis var. chinensis]|uniref:histone acetyltransferase n=1 Tax=Actinidia chinensis var. chinensis TaxID=1590841 RepID=A0A2R6RKL2_ACTCC|nr:Histone acetyltransferase [Actinidia chinensis var. chinensis]